MKRTISLGTAAAFGLGSALIALSPAAQAAELTYTADIPGVGSTELQVDVESDIPDTVDPGYTQDVTYTLTVTVPADVADELYAEGARTADGGIDTLFTYALDQAGDTIPVALPISEATIEEGQPLALQATGVSPNGFNAPDSGSVELHGDDLDVTLNLYDEDGDAIDASPLSFEAAAPEDSLIQTITVNEDDSTAVGTATSVVVTPERINFGDDVEIEATVTADEGDDTPEGDLVLNFAGETYPETAEDGVAEWMDPGNIPAGVYDFTVDFVPADAEAFAPSTGEGTLVVFAETETALHLEVEGETFGAGDDIEVTEGSELRAVATPTAVPEEAGEPAGEVLFEIEGILENGAETASPAIWDLTAENLEPGQYTIVATFQENAAWGESVSEEIEFTVVSATTGAGDGTGALPATGATAGWNQAALAVLLVGAGGAAIVIGRRKKAFLTT